MKILATTAVLALGFATQAMAGPGAEATPKFNPGVAPKLAQKYAPKYAIVAAKVAQGVKVQNPTLAVGLNPQPEPPSQGMLPARPE
ncbi:hypothetical protein [Taklimakanibacter lacteus]|uniref:hypothetical protein n=1 Tax=Taklimakanibacter lacteus TaxID=2268456 RepID=UPI000E661AE4